MIIKASPLPCIEPIRCFLSSKAHGVRLTSNPNGVVNASVNRESWEEWTIVTSDDGTVVLRSTKHGRRLVCADDGHVETFSGEGDDTKKHKDGWDRWLIEPSKSGGASLVSVASRRKLGCDDQRCIYAFIAEGDAEAWMTWNIEFLSGELCFISSPTHDVRIHCNPLGKVSTTANWKGWEVWRFVETGDGTGSVYVESWAHRGKFLASSAEGNVESSANAERSESEKWTAVKAPGGEGVILRSVAHGKMLGTDGTRLRTTDDIDASEMWHLETANRGVFFLSNVSHDLRAGSRPESADPPGGTFTTKKRKDWEGWFVEEAEDGSLTLKSDAHGRYLSSDENGAVTTSPTAGESEIWWAEPSPHRDGKGIVLVSDAHRTYLSCTADGTLLAVPAGQGGSAKEWHLEPRLPASLSGPQLGALCAAGVVTVACAAAMPFAVMGALGGLGFTSEGVAAGSAAAGMMSAEAMASGGGVAAGGLVATCQSIGAAGLGAAGLGAAVGGGAILGGSVSTAAVAGSGILDSEKNSAEDCAGADGLAPNSRRPFCAWRSW